MPETVRVAVLVSGGGSNLEAILKAQKEGHLAPAVVGLVISNRPDVKALKIADQYEVPALVVYRPHFKSDEEYDDGIIYALEAAKIRLICLAGFLRKLGPQLIEAYCGRILNIHPSLLPKHGGAGMYGHYVHEAVLKSGHTESGCSVHVVDEEFDHGAVIARAQVPVLPQDTPETLAARVLEQEHRLYPKTIAAFASSLSGAHHD